MKLMNFLNWSNFKVDDNECRWCFIKNNEEKIWSHIKPVYKDKLISIRQDAEWPVPWFYVVSINEHIWSIADIPDKIVARLWIAVKYLRIALRDVLLIGKTQIYQEERIINSHYHIRVLPLRDNVVKESFNGNNPKIYDNNIVDYINKFSFEENNQKILEYNEKIKEYLINIIDINEKFNSMNI